MTIDLDALEKVARKAGDETALALIAEVRKWKRSANVNGQLRDVARAERDALQAKLDKVREALTRHPECDRYGEDDVISCGWKSAVADVTRALGGDAE